MSLKMRYYYIVGIWSFCFVLPIMMGCMREEKKSSKDSFEMLYQQMEQASVESPEQVSQMVDSALPSLKDSMMYYRLLFLKVRGYFLSFKLDSASYLLDKVTAFCDRTEKNKDVYQLYALIYNARGNLFVRTSQIDSASFCFQRAFEYASRGGKRESLPDICLNLADVFVKQGRYDLGSFWYNRSLSISDSLNMPDEQRFPAYYGLAQVNMELRDFALCDYYYDLASHYYDKMHPFEKHIYLNNRGNSYYYRQDYETALGYFRRSLEVVNQYPDMTFERNLTMINLGEIFLMLDCTDSASYYLQECRGFFDSIRNERVKMRAAEIKLKYTQDSTLMKKEISIREKENQVLQLYQWLYMIVGGGFLLAAVVSVIVLYRKRLRDREQWRMQNAITSLRLENVRNRLLRIQIRLLLDNQVEIVVSDNGGGYRKVSVNHGTGTGMKVITQTIQLLNTYNSRPIQMKINNVLVGEEKEMGCEVRFVIPLNYSYQLKKN